MDLREIQHADRGMNIGYGYAGIPMFCAAGVHEQAFAFFQELKLKPESQILILAAGAGAFDQRLLDHGYSNITSVEFVKESYLISGTKFYDLDLNQNFSHLGKFEAVIAIEIIEHLENQFHFMREIKKLLTASGHLILSTPNVNSSFARLKYFLLGKLHWFSSSEIYATGHISPIFKNILDFNLSQSKLKIIKTAGDAPFWKNLILKYKNIFMKIVYLFSYFFSLLETKKGPEHNNNINIFLISHEDSADKDYIK